MADSRPLIAAALLLAGCTVIVGQVQIPSTGAAGQTTDSNWSITSNDVAGETATGPAPIVSPVPAGWVTPDSGTGWIGPNSNQTNRGPSCCMGQTTYKVSFQVADPASASVQLKVAGGQNITMWLNSVDDTHIVYSTESPTFGTAVPVNLKQGGTYTVAGGWTNTIQFASGTNTITVQVLNYGGGPTGLYVNNPSYGAGSGCGGFFCALYQALAQMIYSLLGLPEPVDGASGQYFDVFNDLKLGGPLGLEFRRFYGSLLSGVGASSALGVNWMHNFDLSVHVSGTNATVLLLGGRVVKFAGSGSTWKLGSPLNVPYQLLQSSSGTFTFVDPVAARFYGFSKDGLLQSITDRYGNSIVVTQGTDGPTQAAWGPYKLTFAYANKQLTGVADQSGRTLRFAYTNGLLSSFTDAYGGVTNYTYTSAGKLTGLMTKRQLPNGDVPTTETYDSSGRVVTQTDSGNNRTTLAYDTTGGTTITDAQGKVTKQTYDANGHVTGFTGPMSTVASKFTYDASARRTGITNRMGNSVALSWDTVTGLPASKTDSGGNVTKLTYVMQSQNGATFPLLSQITHADGTKTSYAYNNQGSVVTKTLRDGSTIGYTYDAQGRRISETNVLGGIYNLTYNPDFTLASVQDALGNTTAYSYDTLGRPVGVTEAGGGGTATTYDAMGRVTSYTNEYGNTQMRTYDANGRLASRTNYYGATATYRWNADGNLTSYTDSLGGTRQFAYDYNQRLSSFTNALGQSVRYTRDAVGNLLTISGGANGAVRATMTYNAENRRTSYQDALSRKWTFTIDAFGRTSAVTSPLGNKLTYQFNKQGKLVATADQLGRTTTLVTDAMGRASQIQAPGGVTTKIQRNAAGQATAVTDPNGNVWTRIYDSLGRLTGRTDPLGNATSYSYTAAQLTSATTPMGAVNFTLDPAGRVTQRQYWDGTTLNYSYDAAGQLISADGMTLQRDLRGQITGSNGLTITRDALGRIAAIGYADGKTVTYTYSATGKLTQIADWVGGTTSFTYDAAGAMTGVQRPNGVPTAYTYDGDGRLTKIATGSLGSIALTLDAAGRVTAADRNLPVAPVLTAGAQTFAVDAASQLTGATVDGNGRVTALGTRTFTWDGASRITSIADGGTTLALTYDSQAEVATVSNGTVTSSFVFNYAMRYPALSVLRQGGADMRYYVYLPNGKLLYSIDAADGSRQFFHFDEGGNTVFLTGDSGAVTDSYAMTPYGEILSHPGTSDNFFTYQGEYGVIQEAPGLYYMRARHYDAATARFLSRDTVVGVDPRDGSPYSYARGNPMKFHDPLGNGWFSDAWNSFTGWVADTFFPPDTPPADPPDPPAPDPSYDVAPSPEIPPDPPADPSPAPVSSDWYAPPPDPPQPAPDPPAPVIAPDATDATGGHCCDGLAGLIGHDGASLIGHDGASLITSDGGGLITSDGGGLITSDGGGLITSDGGGLITSDGGGLLPPVASPIISDNSEGLANPGAGTTKSKKPGRGRRK